MNYVDNSLEISDNQELSCGKVINVKKTHTIIESNLMTLPIFSLKRKKKYNIRQAQYLME